MANSPAPDKFPLNLANDETGGKDHPGDAAKIGDTAMAAQQPGANTGDSPAPGDSRTEQTANTDHYQSATTGGVPATTPTFVEIPYTSTENNPISDDKRPDVNGEEKSVAGQDVEPGEEKTNDFEFPEHTQNPIDNVDQAKLGETDRPVGAFPRGNNAQSTANAQEAHAYDQIHHPNDQRSLDKEEWANRHADQVSNQFPAALTQSPFPDNVDYQSDAHDQPYSSDVSKSATNGDGSTFAGEEQHADRQNEAGNKASKMGIVLEKLEDDTRTLAVRLVSPVHHPKTGQLIDHGVTPFATTPDHTDPVTI